MQSPDKLSPGLVRRQPGAVEDQAAIINLLAAYAHYANIGDIDGWAGCFTSDATYAISAPGAMGQPLPIAQVITAETPQFASYRRLLTDTSVHERKIYCIVNPFITRLTGGEASVIAELVQLRASADGPAPHIQLTGTYRGDLVRTDDIWRLRRWEISTTRRPASVSEVPALWWLNVAESADGDWRDAPKAT